MSFGDGGVRAANNWPLWSRGLRRRPDPVQPSLPERIETPDEIHDILVGLANSYEEDIARFEHEEERAPVTERIATAIATATQPPRPPPIVWFPTEPECPSTDSKKSESALFSGNICASMVYGHRQPSTSHSVPLFAFLHNENANSHAFFCRFCPGTELQIMEGHYVHPPFRQRLLRHLPDDRLPHVDIQHGDARFRDKNR